MDTSHTQRGYTLLELTVTLSVLVLLTGVGVVAISRAITEWQTNADTARAAAAIRWVRSVAIADRRPFVFCPVNDLDQCTQLSVPSSRWIARIEGSPVIERSFEFPTRMTLVGTAGRSSLNFRPDGSSPGTNVTLKLCDKAGKWRRTLILSNGGRLRTEMSAEGAICG